jgi:D-beta-D-heptose 7-phosphate kinase/D-beta-D-heptose 1-phosphate adenosyltransferase
MNPVPETPFTQGRARELIQGFRGKRVLVLGDVMLDRYLWGAASRISPEAPVPIVEVEKETVRLGGAANVANNVASLGGEPLLLGIVGEDAPGKTLLGEMEERRLATEHVLVDPRRQTSVKTRIIARGQQVVRADQESRHDVEGDLEDWALRRVRDLAEKVDAIIVSDYGKGLITASILGNVLPLAERRKTPTCVDPKENHFRSYRRVSVITPNQQEAGAAFGAKIVDDASLDRVGWGLKEQLECRAVLITRGEKGMSLFESGLERQDFPTVAREVYDVTGAGDTVVSCFALALASGATFREAAILSNHAAGTVIRVVGTATASPEELQGSVDRAAGG